MASFTKTVQSELIAITNVSASAQSISSEFACTTHLSARIFIDIAPEATNVPGTELIIQISQKDTGNDAWVPIWSVLSTKSTVNSSGVDGTEAAGSTVIEEATTTGLALNQWVFFKNGTLANSEWSQIVALSASTSFTIRDGLTNAQTGSTWYNMAERFSASINLRDVRRLRVVCNNNYATSSVAVDWRCALITCDAIS